MPIELLQETPSQTAGPYVHIGLALAAAGNPARPVEIWSEMAKPGAPGEHILLLGNVHDGNGHLVRDSFLELWQANHEGVYDEDFDSEKAFNSFGRTATTFDAGEWHPQYHQAWGGKERSWRAHGAAHQRVAVCPGHQHPPADPPVLQRRA